MKGSTCTKCGEPHKHNEADPCLGMLPGVMNACCGHGKIGSAYLQFLDGQCIRGQSALIIIEELKKQPEEDRLRAVNFIKGLRDQIEDLKQKLSRK